MRSSVPDDQGKPFVATIANPAAGINVEIVATVGQRWSIDAISLVFTTDATVANRTVGIEFFQILGTAQGRIWNPAVQAASVVGLYHFTKWIASVPWSALGNHVFPLRGPTIIDGALGIRILADNIQATDQFSNIYVRGQGWLDDV